MHISAELPESRTVVHVREAVPADTEALFDLDQRLADAGDFLAVTPLDPVTGGSMLNAALGAPPPSPHSRLFVGEIDGRVAGIALCRDHAHDAFSGVVQLSLAVDPTARGHGLGTALLSHVADWADSNGVRMLQLAVVAENDAARRVYGKAGFAENGCLPSAALFNSKAHDLIIMSRQGKQH